MTGSPWSPDQYNRFRTERQQPFFDLLALVQRRPQMRVVDLGCGTGELTRIVHERLAARDTLGIDSSETMLAASREFTTTGLRFTSGDIGHFEATDAFDLVFSNAALHWIADHRALFSRLTRALAADGQLAVQMPANWDHPSHVVAAVAAGEEPFRSALHGFALDTPVWPPERYAELLHQLGYRAQHVRLQAYLHPLAAADDVIEWVKGTLLTAYQRRLPAALWPAYLARYRALLLAELGEATRPYLFTFKRLLIWAQR
jgi:trans-aconitate 2-methyltransferase